MDGYFIPPPHTHSPFKFPDNPEHLQLQGSVSQSGNDGSVAPVYKRAVCLSLEQSAYLGASQKLHTSHSQGPVILAERRPKFKEGTAVWLDHSTKASRPSE